MNEAQRITEWVEQKKESAIALARAVWGFAEPNWRETQSAAAISAALEAEGFALERRPCGMETAFVATWGGEGPVIAFLGEYDALPALSQQAGRAEKAPLCEGAAGHGCGHNLLGTASLGAAIAIKRFLETQKCPGTVILFGCPGEEGGSGKASVASPAALRVENGVAYATIIWSSSNYDYMKVDDTQYNPTNTEGNSTFEIPVLGFDYAMPVSADTTAMSTPHEIDYTLFFDSTTLEKQE